MEIAAWPAPMALNWKSCLGPPGFAGKTIDTFENTTDSRRDFWGVVVRPGADRLEGDIDLIIRSRGQEPSIVANADTQDAA